MINAGKWFNLAATRDTKDIILGVACGAGAATFWACGLVAARHGIAAGLSPFDIAFHRYAWAGLVFLPSVLRHGIGNLNGIGWRRGLLFMVLSGPFQAVVSASGFLFAPLAHAGVIQPAATVVTGLLLAGFVLREKQPAARIYGAITMIAGILVIGSEAVASIGGHGLLGDAIFALAGGLFAAFGALLRLWRIMPARATAVISALTLLLYVPIHAAVFGFGRMIAAGWFDNVLQIVAQGVFSGPAATYLFARSVVVLGASRATVFPSLVPGVTLLVGFLALGEAPSLLQLAGLAIVLVGFRLTQRV
jgi:drug/metabolite transporter (DMT)-like permease